MGIFIVNRKIFNFVFKNLKECFNLPKYAQARESISVNTMVLSLPWTPKKLEKFIALLNDTFDVDINIDLSVSMLVADIDTKYSSRFWGGIWQPRTEVYQYTGWNIVDRINNSNPKAVLDVGCGFNQFKARIQNLIGIDAFNNSADFMVDILDYNVPNESYDHVIVFGSINFGDFSDIEAKFKKVVDLTMPGGTIYVRANPGEIHKNGQWVDIYPWDFETAYNIAVLNNCKLESFKKDNGNRLYFELIKK
jgi:SAM-dependent methyltransferase